MAQIYLDDEKLIINGTYDISKDTELIMLKFNGEVNNWFDTISPPFVQVRNPYFNKASISYTGQYMLFANLYNTFQNSNYGTDTWVQLPVGVFAATTSYTGQHQGSCSTRRVAISNDYGVTFPNSGLTYKGGNSILMDIDMSDDGRFQLVVGVGSSYDGATGSNKEYFLRSTDTGLTWTEERSYLYNHNCCAISGDGRYQWAFSSAVATYSNNYGATWSQKSVMVGTDSIINDCAISTDGKYIIYSMISNSGTRGILVSNDNGTSWANPLSIISWNCDMSSDGRVMIGGSNTEVYISNDYGVNWTLQTDPLVYGGAVVAVSGDGTTFLVGADNIGNDRVKIGTI